MLKIKLENNLNEYISVAYQLLDKAYFIFKEKHIEVILKEIDSKKTIEKESLFLKEFNEKLIEYRDYKELLDNVNKRRVLSYKYALFDFKKSKINEISKPWSNKNS